MATTQQHHLMVWDRVRLDTDLNDGRYRGRLATVVALPDDVRVVVKLDTFTPGLETGDGLVWVDADEVERTGIPALAHGADSLAKRASVGEQCLGIAWQGNPDERVEGDDRESAARDAISDILTAMCGPAGTFGGPRDGEGRLVRVWNDEARNDATALLASALVSWEGDSEDYLRDSTEGVISGTFPPADEPDVPTTPDAEALDASPEDEASDTTEARRRAVEEAWYEHTKGEMSIVEEDDPDGYDRQLAAIIDGMYEHARQQITGFAVEQWGPTRVELTQEQALADIPRRIVEALALLWYGGRVVS